MRINHVKINRLLKSLNPAEVSYASHVIGLGMAIREYIKNSGISRADFVKKFDIQNRNYKAYVNGGYNYNLHDMAKLNAAVMELETEKARDRVPVKFGKYDYQSTGEIGSK